MGLTSRGFRRITWIYDNPPPRSRQGPHGNSHLLVGESIQPQAREHKAGSLRLCLRIGGPAARRPVVGWPLCTAYHPAAHAAGSPKTKQHEAVGTPGEEKWFQRLGYLKGRQREDPGNYIACLAPFSAAGVQSGQSVDAMGICGKTEKSEPAVSGQQRTPGVLEPGPDRRTSA